MSESKPSTSKPSASTSGPKPKPRAGVQRKSKAEREAFAKEEAERQKARLAEAERNAAAATRGGRGGRAGRGGRGGASTPDQGRDHPVGGNSVFGASTGVRPQTSRHHESEGFSERLEGQSTIKPDESGAQGLEEGTSSRGGGGGGGGGFGGGRGAIKEQQYYETISDDEPAENRRPIEDIAAITLSSDEDESDADDEEPLDSRRKGKQKVESKPERLRPELRPVLPRKDPDPDAKKKRQAEKKSRSSARTKQELDFQDLDADDTAGDAMDLDEPVFVKEQPSSPEMRRRGLKKPGGRSREAKFANETIEERAERLRMMRDVRRLRRVFKQVGFKSESPAVGVVGREDSKQTDQSDDTGIEDSRDPKGELFLFQLPPLTPFLVDSTSIETEPEVKQEPGTTDGPTATMTTTNPAADERDEPRKEANDDAVPSPQPKLQISGTLTATEPTRLPAGLVGKLRLHKSGKVSLDWGGADMEVRYGTSVDFLQDVVMVDKRTKNEPETGETDGGESVGDGVDTLGVKQETTGGGLDGTAYTFGHVRQKMVCIPDWTRLYD